ncbi:interleukin-7 receptor subunit alpha isoform X1 [Pantherophis guttatus]|uniref:Interleukin-7 receptor subunit alpha isoform X1 n=1 Tax=Pantherophis guttatus TaxID=94885 RepID=A0ABM3ZE80_PANGU|nr:interleukin-7 receptor subunit alpha isoform X1 [Pantherophis guttatus]XP_060546694.1 interleukin-7 receptor subunit alpha isoform X1 [Pantherophis guttatus]
MAKPNLIVYTYFFIFLPFTSSESGSGSETSIGYGTCVDDEQESSFKCFTQMPVFESTFVICDATGTEMNLNETNASFSVYETQPRPCFMKNHLVGNCSIDSMDLIGDLDVCLTITLTNPCKNCRKLKAVHIVKPEAPFGLNITYQEKANEYLVQFSTPHVGNAFLANKLIHQLAYRQENTNWTTTESNFVRLKLLGKEFEPEVIYEMKVRSRPNGKYYKGYWSDWSSSQYFKTSARTSSGIKLRFLSSDKVVLITVSIASFFVLFVVILLVPIFWKNRIKAIVWPTIPNHKKTLDKFCHKLRKNSDASFFNPESLGYVDIHKVESIQAKSEVTHLQPPSYNLDAETEDLVEPKSNFNHIHHGWLKLPLAYEGMWSTEMKDKLYGGSENISDDHSLLSINLYNEGRIADQHGWNSNDLCKYSIVPMDHIFPPELKTGSCDHTYSNGETRVLNKEETYVTMASFFENKGL